MRILQLHSQYLSGAVSGENQVVADEKRLLSASGHDVETLVVTPDVGSLVRRLKSGVSVVWNRPGNDAVQHIIRGFRPDIVHVHNLFPALGPSVLRACDVPIIQTLHNYRMMCLAGTLFRSGGACEDCVGHSTVKGVAHGCYRGSKAASAALAASIQTHRALSTYDRVTLFIAVSEFVRRKHAEAGLDERRIGVKPNFAWRPRVKVPEVEDHYLFVGRLSREKGVTDLVEAWRAIDRDLLVVGDGPDEKYLSAIAPTNVRFVGRVDATSVTREMSRARALIVPAKSYEGAPRAIAEAYSVGLPVIAPRRGALPEFIPDGVTGILIDDESSETWRRAIASLEDDATRRTMSRNAVERYEALYSPEENLRLLESIYQDVAERGRVNA